MQQRMQSRRALRLHHDGDGQSLPFGRQFTFQGRYFERDFYTTTGMLIAFQSCCTDSR